MIKDKTTLQRPILILLAALMLCMLAWTGPAFAALSADKTAITHTDGATLAFPVYQSVHIYAGALVMVNASGYAIPGADTASCIFEGIADENIDNSSGSSGDETVILSRSGCWLMTFNTAISQANVGDNVFIYDDSAVDVTANVSNHVYVGIIAKYVSTTTAYVDITPAIQQADVATHIADSSAAHAASAISFADSGDKTAETEVDGALDEIYVDALSNQAFIAIPNVTVYESDATNMTILTGSTTPSLDMANGDTDSAAIFAWGTANDQDPVIFQTPLPPDLDTTADLVVHFRADMSGSTDTPTIAADSYFNEGDTKVEDTSAAVGATYAEKTITIAAADIPSGAQTFTCELTPGAHTTDTLYISAIWIEYTRTLRAN